MDLLFPILALVVAGASAGIAWLAIAAIGLTVVSTVYSYQQQQKAAKDQLRSGGVEITRHDANAGLTIIYGERAIGGVKTWKDVSRRAYAVDPGRTVFGQGDPNDGVGTTFQLNAWLSRIDVLGQGPVEGITNIEIDEVPYTNYRFAKNNHSIYRGVFMDGSSGQTALTELSDNSTWKATSVGNDVAYMYSRFRAGTYGSGKLDSYFSGEPNVRYHVKGRLIWDPRDPAQSSSDPSTWLWSDNPALCLLDYLTQPYGRNLDYSQIDIDSFKTAADGCDVLVTIPSAGNETGSILNVWDPVNGVYVNVGLGELIPNYRPSQVGNTQKRLTCNAALDPSTSVVENVKILLQSMRGTLPYHNGKYSLKLEDVAPTSMAFDEDDIIGGIQFSQGDRSKRYNRTTVVFKNRNKKYKEDRASWPALDSAEYAALLAEDNNEELFYEIGLDAVTDYYQAEDLAEFITMSSREQLTAQINVKSKAILLEPGDVVEITHSTPGWTGRKFRVRSVKFNTDHTVTLALTEYNASIYTWRNTDQEPLQEDLGLPSPFEDRLPVTNLAASIARVDTASGVPQGQVTLTFTSPVGVIVNEYIVRHKPTGSAVWTEHVFTALQDALNTVTTVFVAPNHDTTYDLEVNYLDSSGSLGESAVSSFTVPAYRTDLDLHLETIQTEAGEILERDDGAGGFIPADLTDLAEYYKNSEVFLQGQIDTVDSELTASTLSLQSQVDGLNSTISDLTLTSSAVYLQDDPPVAGVGGVPDPIPTNSRWYDSNDSNHPYIWDGSQWVSIKDGQVGANQVAIAALEATVDDPATGVSANASAISSLDTTVASLNGTTVSNSAAITNLETTVNDPTTGVVANAGAVSSLETRVTSAEGTIATQSSDITALEATVDDPTTGVAANASAVGALDTRVTATEGFVTAASADITALETTVNDPATGVTANSTAISGLTTRVTTAEGTITSHTSEITNLENTVFDPFSGVTANTVAIGGLDSRVTVAEGNITANASEITNLNTDLEFRQTVAEEIGGLVRDENGDIIELENDISVMIAASSQADQALDTRVTQTEQDIVSQASDITSLQARVTDNENDISGTSTALSALTTRVTSTEGAITSQASDIVSLQSSLSTTDGNVAANASGISSLDTRVTNAEGGITSNASDITTLQADLSTAEGDITANATAVSALDARVTTAEGSITSQASDISSLQSDLTTAEGDITSNTSAISGLTTRVTATEGSITSQASDISQLQSDLSSTDGSVSANTSAVSALDTRVASAEGSISSQSASITALQSSVSTAQGDITANASAVSGLETRVTATEGDITSLEAEYYVNLDVDGHVTGIKLYNTGATSAFTVQADQFSVIAPGATSVAASPFSVDTAGSITMNANVQINGDLVVDGTITQQQMGNNSIGGDQIINGSVSANELEISANAGSSGERMYFNGTDNRIEIFDATNTLRVVLGDLTGL